MRILHVISRLTYGGAAALVTQWATYLQRTEHLVDVCTIYTKGQFAEQLERQGIKVYDMGLDPEGQRYHPRRKYDLRVLLPLARLVRSGSYDIVHAHLFPTTLFVASASFFAREPGYIFSEHNVFNRRRLFRMFKILDWAIYSRYAQIIAVSDQVGEALLRWLPGLEGKVQVVPNAVDPEHFRVPEEKVDHVRQELGIKEEDKVVLYAGRMQPAKGPDILLEALSYLPARDTSIRVLMAGNGPLEDTLRKQAANPSLDVKVTFLGLRTDLPVLLNLADLVVLPSRWEGLPMILLEAMAARKPVIATNVGGIPEVIEHGVSGWLVPAEDPPALARGIDLLLQSTGLCERLSNGAFQRVCARYSTEAAIKMLLDIYCNVLKERI